MRPSHLSRALIALTTLLMLAACSQTPDGAPPLDQTTWENGTGSVAGYVTSRKAGTDVAGTTVTVEGTDISTTTDESGLYRLFVPVGLHTLVFTKEGHATARVEGLRVEEKAETKYDTIQPEIFDPFLPTVPPRLDISVENGDVISPDEGGNFSFTLSGEVVEPDVNGFYIGSAAFGQSRGINDFLSALNPGTVFFPPADGSEITVELSTAGFEGETSLHVVAYDVNLNRTEVVRYVTLEEQAFDGDLATVTDLSAFAVTFGDVGISTTPFSTNRAEGMFDGRAFSKAVREKDFAALRQQARALHATPSGLKPQQDSLDDVFTWVDLIFSYDGEELPSAFKIYRKLATQGRFWLVGQVSPAQADLDPENDESTLYGFRDAGAGLEAGVEALYYVEAVRGEARTRSETDSVTPLPALYVNAESPEDGATNVSVTPEYAFSVENRSSLLYIGAVVLDRVHAEGSPIEWVALLLSDDPDVTEGAIPHNFDDTAVNETLQPYHGYDWQPIAVTSNGTVDEEGNIVGEDAISVGADFFDVFGLGRGVSDGPDNTFSTGDGSF